MMNLKKFFYKDYYSHTITNSQSNESRTFCLQKSADKDEWDQIKKYNEPIIKKANEKLESYTFNSSTSSALNFKEQSNLGDMVQTIPLQTTYPGLFTGSGYNHETGNTGELSLGFFFDHATGMPILPGSGVKGVLRSVFPHFKGDPTDALNPDMRTATDLQKNKAQFVSTLFGMPKKDDKVDYENVHQLELAIFAGVDIVETYKLRKEKSQDSNDDNKAVVAYFPMSKHDVFLEAFISKGGKDGHILGLDTITPHGDNPLKNPTPLPFLKVLPEVEFTFQFMPKDTILGDGTVIKSSKKIEIFEEILITVGAGAKTNVGYGQFERKIVKNIKGNELTKIVAEIKVIKLDALRSGNEIFAKVLNNTLGELKLELQIEGYKKPVTVKYGDSERFTIYSFVKVEVSSIIGRGIDTKISVKNPKQ